MNRPSSAPGSAGPIYWMNNTGRQFNIDTALATIHATVDGLDVPWMIVVTTSLYLLGYPVTPKDVDISTAKENAPLIEKVLSRYKIDFINHPDGKFRSAFTKYLIEGAMVEVMGGLEINTESGWVNLADYIEKPVDVEHNGRIFRVPGADDQKRIYTLFNREKDRDIKAMINNPRIQTALRK